MRQGYYYYLHFTKQIVLCNPGSERSGTLPEVTLLGAIKARIRIHVV